jgi:hypothetical protein
MKMGGSSSAQAPQTPEVWSNHEPCDEVKEDFKGYPSYTIPNDKYLYGDDVLTEYPETCKELKKLYEKNVGYVGKYVSNDTLYTKHGRCSFEDAIGPEWDEKKNDWIPVMRFFVFKTPFNYAEKVLKIYKDEYEKLQREQEETRMVAYIAANANQLAYLNDYV